MRHKAIECRPAIRQLSRTFAAYERLKFKNDTFLCEEVKRQRAIIRRCNASWRYANSLPCGNQDALGDRIEEAFAEFRATFDAIRLLRDRMPENVQFQTLCATGDA